MQVKVWRNGKHSPSAWYGLAVPRPARERYFDRQWREAVVVLPGGVEAVAPLRPTFWTTCSELRPAALNRWLQSQDFVPWPDGVPPPVLELTPQRGNRFVLTLVSPLGDAGDWNADRHAIEVDRSL